jgi:ribosome production factor 2
MAPAKEEKKKAPRPAPRLGKPKNARSKRALEKRAPKTVEVLKKLLILTGGKSSAVVKSVLTELGSLKKGECLKLTRKNEQVRPFEAGGELSLEFLARKADCSLFALGSHSKKRPHNLVLGRMFDFRVLDMLELGVRAQQASQSQQLSGGSRQRDGPPRPAHLALCPLLHCVQPLHC